MSSADRPGGKRRRNGFLKSSGLGLEALNGTLLSIDRLGRGRGRDRPYYSGKHKRHVAEQCYVEAVHRLGRTRRIVDDA
jgi:hypothetical protein